MPFAPWFDLRVVRSHLSAWIRAPPTISEATASRLHLVEPGKKNVRVSRSSCVEWSDARESVFMVCGRRPRRVLKLRSRKTESPSFITRLCCLLLMSSRIRAIEHRSDAFGERCRLTKRSSSCVLVLIHTAPSTRSFSRLSSLTSSGFDCALTLSQRFKNRRL